MESEGDEEIEEDEEDVEPRVISCREAADALESIRLFILQPPEDAEEEKFVTLRTARSLKHRFFLVANKQRYLPH